MSVTVSEYTCANGERHYVIRNPVAELHMSETEFTQLREQADLLCGRREGTRP